MLLPREEAVEEDDLPARIGGGALRERCGDEVTRGEPGFAVVVEAAEEFLTSQGGRLLEAGLRDGSYDCVELDGSERLTSSVWLSYGSFHAGLSQPTRLDRSVRTRYLAATSVGYCVTPLSMPSTPSMSSWMDFKI